MWQVGSLLLFVSCAFAAAKYSDDSDSLQWTKGEDCTRPCDTKPRICHYEFTFERYTVLGPACRNCSEGVKEDCRSPQCVYADMVPKGILTVNREIPGPSIQVCKDDTVVVDVVNKMPDLTTTIHWHGIRMMGTPHMDGVPMVTQCPIQPFTTFRYRFPASEAGTFFWHSHAGSQKLDGLSGALIVRQPKRQDLHGRLYDKALKEHVIFVQDWLHVMSDYFSPGPHLPDVRQVPDNVLINGRGPITKKGFNPHAPISSFTVEKGLSYKFHLVSGTCMTCTFILRIEGHVLTVVAADGGLNFKPTTVDSIGINSADRFEFIVHANQTEGIYYIILESVNRNCQGMRQIAELRYSSKKHEHSRKPIPESAKLGVVLNHPNSSCDERIKKEICISMLQGENDAPSVVNSVNAYYQFHVAFGFRTLSVDELFVPNTYQHYEEPVNDRLVQSLINGISYAFPPSPLLSQRNDIPPSQFCKPECYPKPNQISTNKTCTCTNVYKVVLHAIVDLIVFDTGERDNFNHPFHLHGYNFYVLEMGILPEEKEKRPKFISELSKRTREDQTNLRQRPMRDTISIPARGYLILRFVADNPGYWFMHCHFAYHLESGMAAVYKVGRDSDMPPAPKGFPKCGNFYGK